MSSRVLVAVRVPSTPDEAFRAFTEEIGEWWEPNGLFSFDEKRKGTLAFEPGEGGRLVEHYENGDTFEIGRIRVWAPPERLELTWRQASFDDDHETEVHVRFDAIGDETRVTVEHWGWDRIPQDHAARHGFPLGAFQQREAEWWQRMLRDLAGRLRGQGTK